MLDRLKIDLVGEAVFELTIYRIDCAFELSNLPKICVLTSAGGGDRCATIRLLLGERRTNSFPPFQES